MLKCELRETSPTTSFCVIFGLSIGLTSSITYFNCRTVSSNQQSILLANRSCPSLKRNRISSTYS